MPIRVECSGCQKVYHVADDAAGKSIRCKVCGEATKIPVPEKAEINPLFDDLPANGAAADDHTEDDTDDVDEVDEVDELDSDDEIETRPSTRKPLKARPQPSRGKKSGRMSTGKIMALVGGTAMGLLLLCCGGGYYFISSALKLPAASAAASQPFPVATLKTPNFPELGAPQIIPQTDIRVFHVDLTAANIQNPQPAARMKMQIYLPPGEHAARSLGCVLVAPAGTNLLTGNDIDAPDYHNETLPYAQAGYVAIFYSLDGGITDNADDSTDEMAAGYTQFSAAYAGLANSRAALEFALARLPQVNPQRIFAAGHSSAGTLALLFAEHEPRLKGCIAYAPATDLEERLDLAVRLFHVTQQFPGIVDFVKRSSPKTHISQMKCPVFLFGAADDDNVELADVQKFATELSGVRKDVVIKTTPTGGHYDSMINPGIGQAIEWMKSLPGEQPAGP